MIAPSARAEARAAWMALESRVGEVGAMCSWAWTGTWLDHYGDVVAHHFLLAERDGDPCGMALVSEQSEVSRLRPPTIALGTAGEPPGSSVFVERNRLLASEADRAEVAEALIGELERSRGWQRLRLDGMLPEEARMIIGERRAASWQLEESPLADLSALGAGESLEWLPARRRRRVERTFELLGALECEWAGDSDEALSMLDELISLHEARWQARGENGAFASPRFSAFHHHLVARLAPSGRVALFRVRRGEETLACLYGLVEGRRLLFYQGGIAQHPDNRVRVGLAAHVEFMRACRERGLAEYDFLAPAARYKGELSNRSEQLVWAELERPGARLMLERAARRARAALRDARGRGGRFAAGDAGGEQAS
jgi:Acetyltransferase (GNAT) domain